MIVLAIDTTSECGSIAIVRHAQTVQAMTVESRDGFGHVIFGVIEKTVKGAGLRLQEIDCFAAANGPGSFTGVRVGLAAVKGLAEALGKSVAGISTLRALSFFGTADRRAAVIGARRGEVFVGFYNSRLEPFAPERVVASEEWDRSLEHGGYEVIDSRLRRDTLNLAVGVAACAAIDRDHRGDRVNLAELDANYVRKADAELFTGA